MVLLKACFIVKVQFSPGLIGPSSHVVELLTKPEGIVNSKLDAGVSPLFVKVISLVIGFVWVNTFSKFSDVVTELTFAGDNPFPVRVLDICRLPLYTTVSCLLELPLALGLNVTVNSQVELGAKSTVREQVLVAISKGSCREISSIEIGEEVKLDKVIGCDALEVSIIVAGKESDGVKDTEPKST